MAKIFATLGLSFLVFGIYVFDMPFLVNYNVKFYHFAGIFYMTPIFDMIKCLKSLVRKLFTLDFILRLRFGKTSLFFLNSLIFIRHAG